MIVKIIPLSKWAKSRVQQHGEKMRVERIANSFGDNKILVESLDPTFISIRGFKSKWLGWFGQDDIENFSKICSDLLKENLTRPSNLL